ncbi:MAG: hypothetical protein Q9217_001349 [Psora testacea]
MWKPFSSKKAGGKMKNRRGNDGQVRIVEQVPHAPMPPPAYVPRGEPDIEPAPPRERDRLAPRKEWKTTVKRRPQKVVLHQPSDEDDEETPSSPEPTRIHQRPRRSRTPSPMSRATAEKALHHENKLHQRAEKIAKAEHEAHVRAKRIASVQRRQNDEMRRQQQQQDHLRRIANIERLNRDLDERERRLQTEAAERGEDARRRQEQADIEILRQAEQVRNITREQERPPRSGMTRQPRHPRTERYDRDDLGQRGDAFLASALDAAMRAENTTRTAPGVYRWPQPEGLRRHHSVDGSHGRRQERWRRGHERQGRSR